MSNTQNMTVIISSWNEEENLKECVKSIQMYYPDIEIIVINNGSTDHTQQWLEEQKIDHIYFDEGVQTIGKALNMVFDNFKTQEYILVIWPQIRTGERTIAEFKKTLDKIAGFGVVGCCANQQPYEQNIDIQSYEELLELEKRMAEKKDYKVIGSEGLCYAFSKKLMDVVGKFDENLAYVDSITDFQLRVIRAGYINWISRNAYVYEKEAMKENIPWITRLRQADYHYLREKWNTNYFMLSSNGKFNQLIGRKCEDQFSVLEIGCDMGANLLGIKNEFPNCRIYGVEINKNSVEIGRHVANIQYGNIEEESVDFGEKFDYIIFGDVLEHLHNPLKTIKYCKTLLNENGCIMTSIPNLMHISIMEQLLRGEFHYTDVGLLDQTHIHLFTQKEIQKMFENAGYQIEVLKGILFPLSQHQEELISKLMSISEGVSEDMYRVYQYSVVARML